MRQSEGIAIAACGAALITAMVRKLGRPRAEHPKWLQSAYRQAPLIFIFVLVLCMILVSKLWAHWHR